MLLMMTNDTPNFAKQMVAFSIQHPLDRIYDEFENSNYGDKQSISTGDGGEISSPVLRKTLLDKKIEDKNGNQYNAEDIIYRDLLKCAFGSGGKDIMAFLDKLSVGESMMHSIMCWPSSTEAVGKYYPKKDLDSLQTLIRQLHSMHYQTRIGRRGPYNKSLHNLFSKYEERSISDIKVEIQTIFNEYNPLEKHSLADRVLQRFCYPLGIQTVTEARNYVYDKRWGSYLRHRDMLANGKIGIINKGDFVKSVISSDYLLYILENGVLSKEFLGVGEQSDRTPLDTDVSIIREESNGLLDAISKTSAAAFSSLGKTHPGLYSAKENIFLVFHNMSERFDNDSYKNDKFDNNRYEVFPTAASVATNDIKEYGDEYGIRTGIPSSEIDYIATDEKSVQKIIDAVKESGLYIPVTDLNGKVLFNPFQ